MKRNPAILRVNYLDIARSRGFLQFVLQCPNMPRRIVYFVTRLYGYVAVSRKTIELLDDFFTSIVHVRSLRMGFGNKDRIHPLAG